MDSLMIKELKETTNIIDKIINIDETLFINISDIIKNNNIIFTWMWSSFFISEIWAYFLKNICLSNNVFSCSANEINNNFSFINENKYCLFSFSQSWNTIEVSNILKKYSFIFKYIFTNNLEWEHIKFSNENHIYNIWLEKSFVSTKYVVYSILFLYKLSLIYSKNYKLNDFNKLKEFSKVFYSKYEKKLPVLSNLYNKWDNFIIIWNWLNYIIAKEISLKIRETTWIISSYDDIWQLKHWWINSINKNTISILLENDTKIIEEIKKRWWKIITIWDYNGVDIKYKWINNYIDSIQKIVLLDYFIHILAESLNINTDKKMW